MIKTLRLITSVSFLMICLSCQLLAQSNKRQDDERLARQFYNAQEYDKARDVYLQLYQEYKYYQYLSRYVDCQFYLDELDSAENELRAFIKHDNTTNKWKAQIDLSFVLYKKNEIEKAKRILTKLINELPPTKGNYSQVATLMRSRGFNEQAIMLYDKGSEIPEINYDFYAEKASTYQSMMNFDKSIENYLLYLEGDYNNYDLVKSRLSFMLRHDVDGSVSESMRFALLKKAQEHKDDVVFAELFIWYALQIQDYETAIVQEMALDKRFNDRENDIIYLAKIAYDNAQYEVAQTAFEYVAAKAKEGAFYPDAVVGLIQTQYKKVETSLYGVSENVSDGVSENVSEGVSEDHDFYSDYEKRIENECEELGISDMTMPIVLIRSEILSYKLNETDKAIELLNNVLNHNISRYNKAKAKMALADVYLYKEDVWEATLIYSQVDKAMKEEPIGHEARFKNAKLRYYIGEFEWALSVLNILKSATSKLIANDAMTLSLLITDNLEYDTVALQRLAKADYYIYQKRYELADKMLDSVNIYNPNEFSMPYLLSRKAAIAMENNNYELADSLYKRIYQGYADSYMADDALLKDAILLEQSLGKKEEAMECYAKLIDEYTASVYVAQARSAYRRLRD